MVRKAPDGLGLGEDSRWDDRRAATHDGDEIVSGRGDLHQQGTTDVIHRPLVAADDLGDHVDAAGKEIVEVEGSVRTRRATAVARVSGGRRSRMSVSSRLGIESRPVSRRALAEPARPKPRVPT